MTVFPSKLLPLICATPDDQPIDIDAVRSLCSAGFGHCPPEDRAIAWLLLSRVLPSNPREFQPTLESQLSMYVAFVTDFGLTDYLVPSSPKVLNGHDQSPQEKLLSFIHGDVSRTTHHIVFFPPSDPGSSAASDREDLAPFRTHLRRIERVLDIFANVNPSLAYLQGFHELCCVLYYVFASAVSWFGNDMMRVETTVFYCFQQLMGSTRIQELFQTDDNSSLIHHRLGDDDEHKSQKLAKKRKRLFRRKPKV